MKLQKGESWEGLHVWGPHPKRPGYLRFVRMATRDEMVERVETCLKANDTTDDYYEKNDEGAVYTLDQLYEYMSFNRILDMDDLRQMRMFKIFMVEGGSEGWYVHAEALCKDGKTREIVTIKVLTSEIVAWEIVKALHVELNRCD